MTVRARSAQSLGPRCLRYHSATREFSYRWTLSKRGTRPVALSAQLSVPSIGSPGEHIMVTATG